MFNDSFIGEKVYSSLKYQGVGGGWQWYGPRFVAKLWFKCFHHAYGCFLQTLWLSLIYTNYAAGSQGFFLFYFFYINYIMLIFIHCNLPKVSFSSRFNSEENPFPGDTEGEKLTTDPGQRQGNRLPTAAAWLRQG